MKCLAAIGLLLCAGPAWGHDFATRTAAHRLGIAVDTERIRLDYTVEVPFGGTDDPTSTARELDVQTPDEVTSGLLVTVDGVGVPLRLDPAERPRARATSHTATIRVWLEADAPAAREATIAVSNANYPDLAGQFWTAVHVDSQVDVLSSDLGADGVDLSGRWRSDEAARTATIHVAFRRGPVASAWARLGGVEGVYRPLESASPATLRTFWTAGTLRPVEFAGLVALAVALVALLQVGALHGPGRRRLVLGVVLAALPALALHWVDAAWVGVVTGLLALGAAAWATRGGPPLAAVAAGLVALSAAAGRPGYAALLALLVAMAALGVRRVSPEGDAGRAGRLVVVLAALSGLVALGRGGLVLW